MQKKIICLSLVILLTIIFTGCSDPDGIMGIDGDENAPEAIIDGNIPIGGDFSFEDQEENVDPPEDDGESQGSGSDSGSSSGGPKEIGPQIYTFFLTEGLYGKPYYHELERYCTKSDACSWAVSGLPEGLSLDTDTIKGTPQEIGTSPVTITLTDTNASKTLEKTLNLKVADTFVVNVYKDSEDGWKLAKSSSDFVLSKGGAILIGVEGHADSYDWTIEGDDRIELSDSCNGSSVTDYNEYKCLVTDFEDSEDRRANEVTVTVEDDFGNKEELEFDITIRGDYCQVPMTVTSTRTQVPFGQYQVIFNIEGGKAPYRFFKYDPQEPHVVTGVPGQAYKMETLSQEELEDLDGTVKIDDNIRWFDPGSAMEDIINMDRVIQYHFYDGCGEYTYEDPLVVEFSVLMDVDDDDIFKIDPYHFETRLAIGANDTDDDGDTKMIVRLLNDSDEEVANWEKWINLGPYGDQHNNHPTQSVSLRLDVDEPDYDFDGKELRVFDIAKVRFRIDLNGNDTFEHLDIKFYDYAITLPEWCGIPEGIPTGELSWDKNGGKVNVDRKINWRLRVGVDDDCSSLVIENP